MEINTKLSQNAYELSKLVNFWIEFDEKTGKNTELCQTSMKYAVVMPSSKMTNTQLTYQNFREG